MNTYTLAIKHTDDTLHPAAGGLDLAAAEGRMEYSYNRVTVQENWAGLAIIDEQTGDIYSELEW